MSRLRNWLGQKRWKLPIAAWLAAFGLVLLAVVVFCIFFLRREIIEYRFEHTFAVNSPEFFGSAHALADPVPLGGNKIDLLENGDQIFPAMLFAIASARKTVNFEAFLFDSDPVGRKFRDAFSERARAGVCVRVLLDGIGSGRKLDNSDVTLMKKAGVHFAYYHPTHSWRIDRINRRTHRRVMVVDGKIGFTGGVGFAEKWSGNGQSKDQWRDLHARIEGPLVGKLQGAFQQHWIKTSDEVLTGADEFPAQPQAGTLHAQMIASHSFSVAPVPLLQAVAISAAERNVFITNAYCTPSSYEVHLLTEAVRRGVDVRLLVPGPHNDQPATKAAGRTAYGKLLEGGVKIFEYQPSMIHSKTMVVDGLFSMFGSSNLDARSAAINEELDITVYDAGFAKKMEAIFAKDLARSSPYTLRQFQQRSLWERFSEFVTLPFRSQM